MTIAAGIYWCFASSLVAAQGIEPQHEGLPSQPSQPAPACERILPLNIWAADQLAPIVEELLARSPSFRRQCAAIAAHENATVAIRLTSRLVSSTRARAEIRHYGNGAIRAVIDVPVTRDAPELVAHEFEHVLEQIDGLDLAALERHGKHGVTEAGDGAFETARAIAAGRVAAGEYYGWDRRASRTAVPGPPQPTPGARAERPAPPVAARPAAYRIRR